MESEIIIGAYKVHPKLGIVEYTGERIAVQPKVVKLLCYFAENPGQVLTRDQIIAQIWGERVVSDDALHRLISIIRNTFKDDAKNPRYLETIPKVGYRLIAEVKYETKNSVKQTNKNKSSFLLFSLVLVVLLFVWYFFKSSYDHPDNQQKVPVFKYITTHAGLEKFPRFSPDGLSILYTQRGLEYKNKNGTYIINLSDDPTVQEAYSVSNTNDFESVWSRNGRSVFTVTSSKEYEGCEIVKHTFLTNDQSPNFNCNKSSSTPHIYLDVSPDGNYIVSSEYQTERNLYKNDINSKEKSLLYPEITVGALYPRLSKVGNHLAFSKQIKWGVDEIMLLDLDKGTVKQVTNEKARVKGLAWTVDNTLIYISNKSGEYSLWAINPFTDDDSKWLSYSNEYLHSIDVSPDGEKLLFSTYNRPHNVFELTINDFDFKQLTNSRRQYFYPSFSTFSQEIYYVSNELGNFSVWKGSSDMEETELLVANTGYFAAPMPAPNSQVVAYSNNGENGYDICLRDKNKSNQCIVSDMGDQMFPTWSWDGNFIYYTDYLGNDRNGLSKIKRYSIQEGTKETIIDNGIFFHESPISPQVGYFKNTKTHHLMKLDLNTGQSEVIIQDNYDVYLNTWAISDNKLFYIDEDKSIKAYDLLDGSISKINSHAMLDNIGHTGYSGLAFNPFNQTFIFSLTDPELNGDITMIENLQELINR